MNAHVARHHRVAASRRDMLQVGLDIVEEGSINKARLAEKRVKKGECPTCGLVLYKKGHAPFLGVGMGSKKTPLTVQGKVLHGRCLVCYPLDADPLHQTAAAHRMAVVEQRPPTTVVLPLKNNEEGEDCATIISGITLDQHLIRVAGDKDGPTVQAPASPATKARRFRALAAKGTAAPAAAPVAGTTDDEGDDRPTLPSRANSLELLQEAAQDVTSMAAQIEIELDLPPAADDETTSTADQEEKDDDDEGSCGSADIFRAQTPSDDPKDIFFDSSQMCDLVGLESEDVEPDKSHYHEIVVAPDSLPLSPQEQSEEGRRQQLRNAGSFRGVSRNGSFRGVSRNSSGCSLGSGSERRLKIKQKKWSGGLDDLADAAAAAAATARSETSPSNQAAPQIPASDPSSSNRVDSSREKDIPSMLSSLEMDGVGKATRESVFLEITSIIWSSGLPAKTVFADSNGIEALTKMLWEDMSDETSQEILFKLLLALVASDESGGSTVSDIILTGEQQEGILDALMIVMQTLVHNGTIQELGCRVLSCLAAASANNVNVNDGTLHGSVQSVVGAMKAHPESQAIQQCGLQTLYRQCTHSPNAESNRRTFVAGCSESGFSGMDVVLRVLKNRTFDLVILEWACQLVWCLSPDRSLMINAKAGEILKELIRIVHQFRKQRQQEYALLLQAAVGSIANLVKVEGALLEIDPPACVPSIALDMVRLHGGEASIIVEACCAISNFASVSPTNNSFAIESEEVKSIVDAMLTFPVDGVLCKEALRALTCLSIVNQGVKDVLCEAELFSNIERLLHAHKTCTTSQELLCTLVSSLCKSFRSDSDAFNREALNAVVFAIKSHPGQLRVQEAGAAALRNLSGRVDCLSRLLHTPHEGLHLVLDAMMGFDHSITIQSSGCSLIWSAVTTEATRDLILENDDEILECLIKAIQKHLESGQALEEACGALWNLVYGSDERKRKAGSMGGIDAMTCVVVMHPESPPIMERACGVLSSLSCEATLVQTMVNADQLVGIVVDAMRNSTSSVDVVRSGIVLLQNMMAAEPSCCNEAVVVVAAVLRGMTEHLDDQDFQREGCHFLLALATLSENGKRRILALDGVSVLMDTLEYYSEVPDVQETALRTFNQLVQSS